jgi:hypothetical protein
MEGMGPGALYEVRNLRPGASVIVQAAAGAEHWRIDGVRAYTKGRVPAGLSSPGLPDLDQPVGQHGQHVRAGAVPFLVLA